MTLAQALQAIGSASASAATVREAWQVVNAALHERWFALNSARFGANADLVEDVRQMVLERLLLGRATFAGTTVGQAVNFVKAIAKHATIDVVRARKREATTGNEPDQIEGGVPADEALRASEISRRLLEVLERATEIRRSPTRSMLERHLRESMFGQPPSDPSLDVDPTEAARLRKERSRALQLLREAHEQLVGEMAHELNDEETDRLIRMILAPTHVTTQKP